MLDVSSCRGDLTEGMRQLVIARASPTPRGGSRPRPSALAFPHARIVLTPTADGGNGLIAVDSDDLVVGASRAARQALGITEARLAGRCPPPTCSRTAATRTSTAPSARSSSRALARADGNVIRRRAALGICRATLHRKLKRVSGTRRTHLDHPGHSVANCRNPATVQSPASSGPRADIHARSFADAFHRMPHGQRRHCHREATPNEQG